jgi:AcrR family transcriptional regulator
MSQTSGDLRVRRTQKLIRDAFIALIEERSFDAITVGEIANRAMVSRTLLMPSPGGWSRESPTLPGS